MSVAMAKIVVKEANRRKDMRENGLKSRVSRFR